MEKILLFILDLFGSLYRAAGIDYKQLRSIVSVKLKMDGRRQTLMMGQQSSGGNRGYFFSLFIYLVFGLLVSMLIYALPSMMYALTFIYSYIMVMVIMILITDFSSVLLDTSDNSILLPRPVSSRTLLVARITHIVLYVGLLVVALSLGSLIAVVIQFGITTFIIFSLCLLLGVLFSVTLTNGLYLLIMRYTTEERLKNTINYLQIGMTILFMGGYQLLPRMLGSMEDVEMVFTFSWWTYLIPSVWLSASVEAIHLNLFDLQHSVMMLLSVVIPISSLYLVSQYLAPSFASKLQVMAAENKTTPQQQERASQKGWFENLTASIANPGAERSGFILTQKAIARDRKLKLKIYPAIGYLVVILVLLTVRYTGKSGDALEGLRSSQAYLFIIYFSTIILHTVIFEISFSDDFKAGWVFFSSPIQEPGRILTGSLKAILTSLFLPFYGVVSIIIVSIWGMSTLDDVLFGFVNNLVIILSIVTINKKHLPLSLPDGARASASNFGRGILMMLVLAFFGILHYGTTQLSGATWILSPFLAILLYFMYKSYSKLSWEELRKGT